jgi:RNA polymerase sigma-70 factor (ECF subfamily)
VEPSNTLADLATSVPESISDEALAAVAATDAEAFETLYLRHRLDLFRFARARTGDDELAADVVSTTFERALARLPTYRPMGAGFRAWLFRIARNEVIDSSRRRRTVERHQAALAPVEAQPGPEDDVIRAEAADGLRRMVARLPDTQRDAVLMRYAGGLSTREIASTLGRSEGAVQKLIDRALAALKEAYRATDR